MTGTLVTVHEDAETGLSYGTYLIRYRNRLWIATFDIDHAMLVQVQEVALAKEKIPEHVRKAVQEWLL
jgi:hypothetical protein